MYLIDRKAKNGHRRFDVGSFTFFLLSNDYTIQNLIYQLISCHKAWPLNECDDFTLKIRPSSLKNSCLHQNMAQQSVFNDRHPWPKQKKRLRTHFPLLLEMKILYKDSIQAYSWLLRKRLDYDFSLKKVPGQGWWWGECAVFSNSKICFNSWSCQIVTPVSLLQESDLV